MQHVFGDPASPWFAPRFDEILAPIDRLRRGVRPAVTFTRFVAPAAPTGAWQEYFAQWPFALQPPDADVRVGRPLRRAADARRDDVRQVRPLPCRRRRIVVAGVSTDCCVLSTVLAAADAGVKVRVAADACAGATDESHRQALELMALYAPLVEVGTVDAVA